MFGCTFSYEMNKLGKKCLVIDRRDHIYCENINGINVHKYGAHIFHTSDMYMVWEKNIKSFLLYQMMILKK